MPKVSVLITSYNREKYITEAIESVLSSSFQDFEIIIVDDASIDRTVEIVKRYEKLDYRIKLYINKKNIGDYPNRNKAASYATGKYLKYLDSDDTMSPLCLSRMVFEMEKSPDCAFGISSRCLSHVFKHHPTDSYKTHFFERGILDLSPSSSIIRRDVFFEEKGFIELRCVSDFEFWLRLALKYPFLEFEKNLVNWREHEGQEIIIGRIEYIEHNLNIISTKLQESNLNINDRKLVIDKYKKFTSREILKNISVLGFKKVIHLFKINKLNLFDVI